MSKKEIICERCGDDLISIKVYDSQYRNRYIVYADNKRERHICFIFNVNNAGEAIEKFLKEKNVNREYFNNISCTLDNEK